MASAALHGNVFMSVQFSASYRTGNGYTAYLVQRYPFPSLIPSAALRQMHYSTSYNRDTAFIKTITMQESSATFRRGFSPD